MRPCIINLTEHQLDEAKLYAEASSIAGSSAVREREDRLDNLKTDAIVGHLGNMALCLYWHGTLDHYRQMRWMQDRFPHVGDGGADLPGMNVDVKASLIRNAEKPMKDYHLVVRPREFHDDHVYILGLVQRTDHGARVYLVGWETAEELKTYYQDDDDNIFKGAYAMKADRLQWLPPMTYDWVKRGFAV